MQQNYAKKIITFTYQYVVIIECLLCSMYIVPQLTLLSFVPPPADFHELHTVWESRPLRGTTCSRLLAEYEMIQ